MYRGGVIIVDFIRLVEHQGKLLHVAVHFPRGICGKQKLRSGFLTNFADKLCFYCEFTESFRLLPISCASKCSNVGKVFAGLNAIFGCGIVSGLCQFVSFLLAHARYFSDGSDLGVDFFYCLETVFDCAYRSRNSRPRKLPSAHLEDDMVQRIAENLG